MSERFLNFIETKIHFQGKYIMGKTPMMLGKEKVNCGPFRITLCTQRENSWGYRWTILAQFRGGGAYRIAYFTGNHFVAQEDDTGRVRSEDAEFASALTIQARWFDKKNKARDANYGAFSVKEIRQTAFVSLAHLMRRKLENEGAWESVEAEALAELYDLYEVRLPKQEIELLRMMMSYVARYWFLARRRPHHCPEKRHKMACRRATNGLIKFYYGRELTRKEQQFAIKTLIG